MVLFNSPVAKIPPFSISASIINEFLIGVVVNVSVRAHTKFACRNRPKRVTRNLAFKMMDN